jgi:hypothetical protein
LRRGELQEQIEPLDQKSEGHDRDRGTNPGEKVRSLAAWSL